MTTSADVASALHMTECVTQALSMSSADVAAILQVQNMQSSMAEAAEDSVNTHFNRLKDWLNDLGVCCNALPRSALEGSIDTVTSTFKHCSALFAKWLRTSMEPIASDEFLAVVDTVLSISDSGQQELKEEDRSAITALTKSRSSPTPPSRS